MFIQFRKKDQNAGEPTIERTDVARAKINRIDMSRLTKIRYTDTNKIVELDMHDRAVRKELMTSGRPIEIIG